MPSASDPILLQVSGIGKRFPGVRALDDVDLTLRRGEVLAVVGENGAGKSTLMKILAGVQTADEGEIRLDGRPVRIRRVEDAMALGIALIHQDLNLADNLDVGGNIFLGREPRRFGFIDRRRIAREARTYMDMVGLDVPSTTTVETLPIGRRQLVEIAAALSIDARVLIMDEPTSSLSIHETDRLFEVIRSLKKRGVSIIYISHRLREVNELADRVVVLRDGKNAGELQRDEIGHDAIVGLMVGREISHFYDHVPHPPGEVVLEADGLRTTAYAGSEVSFNVRAGEIVGMAGLVGAGRTELLHTIFGITPALAGKVRVAGRILAGGNPREAITAGLALVPEDRQWQGLCLEMAVRENLSLAVLRRDQQIGFLNRRAERKVSGSMIEQLRITTPGDMQTVQYLSGGNQQKVVVGKWLASNPRVLLMDEPTRGVDVGAKEEIYQIMERLAGDGVAILFVSSEMEEILGMSDRTLVMHEGRLAGELGRDELSDEVVMRLATGADRLMESA